MVLTVALNLFYVTSINTFLQAKAFFFDERSFQKARFFLDQESLPQRFSKDFSFIKGVFHKPNFFQKKRFFFDQESILQTNIFLQAQIFLQSWKFSRSKVFSHNT